MKGFLRNRILSPIVRLIRKGISPKRLALSLSIGIIIGIIPFYGFTTAIVAFIALGFKLNFVAAQIAHYVVHPVQIALYFPFLKAGGIFYSEDILPDSVKQFMHLMKSDFWGTMKDFWMANLSAMLLWMIIAVPLGIALYYFFFKMLNRYALAYVRKC